MLESPHPANALRVAVATEAAALHLTAQPNEAQRNQDGSTTAPHLQAMRARQRRYHAFAQFLVDAPTRLPRLYDQLEGGAFYRDDYGLCVVPGGAEGGQDPRTLQVFFGFRPFDTGHVPGNRHPALPFAPPGSAAVVERGAMLQYTRTDRGDVDCSLCPAQTEFTRSREAEIRLGVVPIEDLECPAVLLRHLRCLLAYMAGTSLDGVLRPGQRWRYWRLMNLHLYREADGGKWQPERLFQVFLWIAKWFTTVAASGVLLYFVQRVWPLPDTVTPAVNRAAARAHADQQALRAALQAAAHPAAEPVPPGSRPAAEPAPPGSHPAAGPVVPGTHQIPGPTLPAVAPAAGGSPHAR